MSEQNLNNDNDNEMDLIHSPAIPFRPSLENLKNMQDLRLEITNQNFIKQNQTEHSKIECFGKNKDQSGFSTRLASVTQMFFEPHAMKLDTEGPFYLQNYLTKYNELKRWRKSVKTLPCHMEYGETEGDGLGSRLTRLFAAAVTADDLNCSMSFLGFKAAATSSSFMLEVEDAPGTLQYCHYSGSSFIENRKKYDKSKPKEQGKFAKSMECNTVNSSLFYPFNQFHNTTLEWNSYDLKELFGLVKKDKEKKKKKKKNKRRLTNDQNHEGFRIDATGIFLDQFLLSYLYYAKPFLIGSIGTIKQKLGQTWLQGLKPEEPVAVCGNKQNATYVAVHYRAGDRANAGHWSADLGLLGVNVKLVHSVLDHLFKNSSSYDVHIFTEAPHFEQQNKECRVKDFPEVTSIDCSHGLHGSGDHYFPAEITSGQHTYPVKLHLNSNPLNDLYCMGQSHVFFGSCSMFSSAVYVMLNGTSVYPECSRLKWAYSSTAGIPGDWDFTSKENKHLSIDYLKHSWCATKQVGSPYQ